MLDLLKRNLTNDMNALKFDLMNNKMSEDEREHKSEALHCIDKALVELSHLF